MPNETSAHPRTGRTLIRTRWPGIYQRGDRYVVRVRDHRGRQVQRAAPNLTRAKELRAELTTDVIRGEYRPETRVTLAQYAEQWLGSYSGRTGVGIRPLTLHEYGRDLELHVLPYLGKRRLSSLTAQDVKGLITKLEGRASSKRPGQTLAAGTVRNAIAPLRALLATAVEEGLLRSSPMGGIRMRGGSAGQTEQRTFTDEEVAGLIAATLTPWKRTFLRLLSETGLRIGEAVALEWRHVDLANLRIMVRQRRYRETTDAPKSRFGVRDVPIGHVLGNELRTLKVASRYSTEGDPIFASREGLHLRPENLRRSVLLPAIRAAGIRPGGFHAFRRGAITRWAMSGIDPKRAQVMAGHHDVAFTLQVYARVTPDDLPSADAMDALAIGSRRSRSDSR